ncbi:SIR2 family protein [Paraburkholderia nemoris]|uniref:SIR2 family protein n=1 Tax=Paraburkholderia nemoris TaxID=2793076 RepID=UPI0038BB7CA5
MPMDYKQYQEEVTADIAARLAEASCQPILFVGSGFAKRYAKGPNWDELLTQLAEKCPLIDKPYAYYKQANHGDQKKIGTIFSEHYRDWAWTEEGKKDYLPEYYVADAPSDIFIKHTAAEILKDLGPDAKGSYGSAALDEEIAALRKISAHAFITTNYDQLIETLFPGYEVVIGQQIMRRSFLSIGEIFKIHGCRTLPSSIVLDEADYDRFEEDHKYLSAKLLTYFVEHPLLFVGYKAEDPNIKAILYDVHRMVQAKYQLIPNIYILERDETLNADSYPARDRVINIGKDENIRIKSIAASSFKWVYEAFGQAGNLENIDTKLLRSLMARSVELIRSEIPKKKVEIDFKTLEHAVETGETFAKLFGVTTLSDPSKVNLDYKYVLTGVAQELGFRTWHEARKLIKRLKDESGFDMLATDNKYHIALKTGQAAKSRTDKYTDATVDLLRKVMNNEKYTLDDQPVKVERKA